MKTKHTRRSGIKSSASRWYVLLALMGFLTILLWPSMTAAVPLTLTDAEQLKQAWEYAADVGVYRYQTDVLQTTHPTEKLVNVGRSSKIDRFSVVGMMDRPNDTMQMRIQADGTIELKVVEGVSYGRVNSQDEWTQVENQSDFFAPGGDPLGYLNAAENIQEAKDMGQDAGSGEPDLETALANPHSVLGTAYSVYTFDLNGPKYARFMRDQMEEHLRRTGELPLNMNLELARTYIDMQGCGEIWIDAEANLPVRQVIHLEFPPERGALEWVSANITTNFFEWEELTSGNQGAASLTRLWENPTVLSTQVVKSLASANIRQFAFTLGLSLSVLGLVALSITYCRSPKFYAAISLSVIFSMVSTPLMQSNQVYAFYEQQQAKQVEYEQQVEQQNEQAAIEAELAGRNFDPQVNPLANSPALLVPDFSRQSAITITATYTTGHDTDSDGLTDEVELLELGTSPEYVDSDGDGISDISEVTGFNNGTQWYLNPLDIDSNGDGLADLAECPDLGDVDENEELISPSGSRCQDIDNDGTPDVFDFDNDGDGVPDAVDSTPNHTGRPSTTSQGELTLNLNNYQNERTLLVDFELRPVDDSHLWYIYNVLDWPDDDTSGQIMRTTDDNLTDDGDIMLSPVLEIVLPYSDANPSRGLPISASVTITANTPIANWLDQGKLDEYSISVTQDDDGTLYAYVPLVVIQDVVGDSPAAWGARMLYTMDSGSTGWGEDHTIKLLWMVTAVTDTCDTSAMSDSDDYDDYCAADSGHWVSANSVIQTYYEDFYLTSLYVKQEHGMQAAVIAQNDALSVPYEDSLWHLADGLQDAFLAPELVGGSTRFDIAEIETRFDDDSPTYADGAPERWDIPKSALDVTAVYTYPDQTSGLNDMINSLIPGVLDTAYAAATADDRVTLLFAREESYKSTTLGDSEVAVGYGSLSVDLGALDEKTLAGLNWAAYVYDGLGWDSDDVDDYLDYFELQLDSVIDLNSLLGGEVVSDEDMARAGAISLAQNYYLAFYQGISGLVEIGGDPTDSTGLDDGDYGLDGQTTENLIIGNLLSLLQTVFDEEDAIIMDGQELSDAALTTFFSEGELAVALGELDNGALTLKARKLGKNLAATLYKKLYKKIHDIHGTKTTAGKWAKRGATGITLLNAGIVGYLYLSGSIDAETASTIIYSSASVSSSLSLFASYSTLKKLRRAEFLSDIKGIQKYTQVGAVAGAALEIGIAVGMMVYTVLSQGIEFGSPEFYGLLAQTIAQVIIAIVYAVIAATVVGSIIIAFITLIDALLGALCATDVIDAEEGDAVDTWVCGGITGALTVILTYVILDYTPLVDLEREDRLDVVLNDPTLTQITEASGYVEGNQITFSGIVTSSLYMNSPNWMGYYYPWQLDDDYLEESSFEYRFQQSESDVGIGLNKTDWDVPAGREPETAWDPIPNGARFYKNFDVNKAYTFGDAGINQNLSMYLSEGFTMNAQNCWLLPTLPPTPVCYLQDFQDTFHTDMSEDMQFDILPNTVGGFRELTLVENDSYRLAWDSQFPTLADADNDGLRSKEMGGPDPNDSNPDTDGDGLSDYWEYANGFDLQDEDADQDGLTDYWEAFYDSDPNQSDSDNDGLSDYHEVFHPNKVYPYENSVFSNDNPPPWAQDASAWAGGWDIVYEFTSSGQPLSFWVSADPNDADADGDSITDSREKIYGYNPNVATELKVLSLDSAIETSSGHTPYVAPGGQISYTATISNELDNRYARGLLQIEFPRDTVQSTQIIETLDPLAVVDMSGQIDVDAAITTSFATSATVRAGAIIDQGTGRMLWLRMNETSGSVLADSSMQGHDATCGPCPTLTGQYLIFSNSGEIVTVDTANDDFERNSFSVGAWVYPTLFFNSVILQDGSHYDLSLSNGLVPSARVYLSGGQQVEAQNTGESLTLGVWNHVMFTFSFIEETQTAEITLYLNGEAVDSDSHTGESLRSSPTSLQLGAGLFGYLDEVEFYASTLNDNEVRALVAVPILDIDFATMSDQSDSGASVGCSGDFCPTTSVDTASFDQLDYLTVSDPELDLSGGPFSFAGWIKPKSRSHAFDGSARSTFSDYLPDTSRDWQGVFGITDWDQDDHYPSLYLSSSGHVWVTFKNDGVTCEYKSSSGLVDNGVWQHLVVAFDGTGFSIFVNGKEVDSSGAVCSIAPPSLTTFTVGRPNSHSYFYFNQLEMTSWDDGLDFCEEVRLNYDGSQKWSKDVCDPNPYTSPDTVYKSIDKGYLFDDLGNHSFKLWEEDSWPNGDDTYLNETINYADLFDGNTAYDDGGSEGNLYWSLSNDYFRGELQTFKLYNYGLPAASVADLFSSNATALEMPFDEAPGQHTLADTSGNGFFATCSQATGSCPDSGIPGRSNQALRFDGGVADDDGYDGVADYATVEATTDLLGLYDTSFSVLAWIKADDLSGDRSILGAPTQAANEGLHLIIRDAKPYMGFFSNDTAGATTLETERWYHLAWVYDKDSSTQSIYVNGVLDTSEGGKSAFVGAGTVEIGRSINNPDSYFDGLIDDLSIVRRALDVDEVEDYMLQAPIVNLHLDENLNAQSFGNDSVYAYSADCVDCPAAGDKGQMREALVFDGDDSLTMSGVAELNKNNFSVGMWVNPRAFAQSDILLFQISDSNASNDAERFQAFIDSDGNLIVGVTTTCTKPETVYRMFTHFETINGLFSKNQWQHLMITHLAADGLAVYFNGQLKGVFDEDITWRTDCTAPSDLVIGENLVGNLDEVVIYGGALSADQVSALHDYQNAWFDVAMDHTVIVDVDQPQVSLALYTDHISTTEQIMAIDAHDDTSPIVTVEYKIDGGDWTAATQDKSAWVFTYDAVSPGSHWVYLRATDSAGNASGEVSREIIVDNTPPIVTVDAALTSAVQQVDDSLLLSGTIADSESGVSDNAVLVELQDWRGQSIAGLQQAQISAGDWQLDYPIPNVKPYGDYDLVLNAQDQVGNPITTTANLQLDGYGPYADLIISTYFITSSTSVLSGTVGDILHQPQSSRLHLHFEEAAGATEFGDGSGNHFAATCSGAACPAAGQSGQHGSALRFDGVDDGLSVYGTAAVSVTEHLGLYDDSFTAMAWLNADDLSGDRAVLGAGINSANQGLFVGLRDGKPHLGFTGDDTTGITTTLSTGQWVHLAWRYDLDSGEQALFINGELELAVTGHDVFSGTGELEVGQALGGRYFDGLLDEVAIYSGALDDESIWRIANPLDVGVDSLWVRLRHAQEGDLADDEGIWYAATLDDVGQLFGTWQLALPNNLEGPYRIDLKVTDTLGNQSVILNAWTGTVDLLAPRLDFVFEFLDGQNSEFQIGCTATDYNLVQSGWECPIGGGSPTAIYEDADWFTTIFGSEQKLAQLTVPLATIVITTTGYSGYMSACDLVGNCVSKDNILSPGGVDDNLQLWLRADAGTDIATPGASVTTWADQSGRHYDAAQSVASHKPTYQSDVVNGYPVLRFDASNDDLLITDTLAISSSYTILTVFNTNSTSAWRRAVQSQDNNWFIGPYNDQIQHYAGGWVSSGFGLTQGQFYLTTARNNKSASTFWIDGADHTTNSGPTASPGRLGLGAFGTYNHPIGGDVAEVIAFSEALDSAERNQIESYLALKYGVTLTTSQDYVDSFGTTIWGAARNSGTYNDVAGIGRDNNSGLAQWRSKSANSDAIVTIAQGSAITNPQSSSNDQSFLVWGNDDGLLTATKTITVNNVAYQILDRVWRVQTSGSLDDVTVSFDLGGLGYTPNAAWVALVRDNDSDFSSGATLHTTGASVDGDVASLNGVQFDDAEYFTLLLAPGEKYNVFDNVPQAWDYQFVYELDMLENADYDWTREPDYAVDNSATLGAYDRVAYYMELVLTETQVITWAYVSMPAFSPDPGEISVPSWYNNTPSFEQTVSDMYVDSNQPGVVTGTVNTGNLEFWYYATDKLADSGLGGSDGLYDFDDSQDIGESGSFQIHNYGAGQTIMAWNGWSAAFYQDEMGIGNWSGANPDWTGANNAGNLTLRRLYVLARPGALVEDDSYTTPQGKQLVMSAPGVLENDSSAFSAELTQAPAQGSLSFDADGSFIYTPTLSFEGADTFVYAAGDGVITNTATVTIAVTAANCFVETNGDNITDYASTDSSILQDAIDAASSGDTIKVAGTCPGVVAVGTLSQTLYIDKSLTVQGGYTVTQWLQTPDANLHPTTLDAENNGRVALVLGGDVTLSHLTLKNGTRSHGGGIFADAALTVINSILMNNSGERGGAIYNGNELTVINTTLADNTVDGDSPIVDDSRGGAIYNDLNGELNVSGSTFQGNVADQGGALYNWYGDVVLTNNTLYDNTGVYYAGALRNTNGYMKLEYNTIANNQTGAGDGDDNNFGGIFLYGGLVYVRYNIIADNSDLDCDSQGGYHVLNQNVMETPTSRCESGSNSIILADPQLGPLADNGGDTETMAITADSPAYNAGDSPGYFFLCPATDQRGYGRPQGSNCDVGAFEVDYVDIGIALAVEPEYPQVGQPVTYTVTFANNSTGETLTDVALTSTLSAGILSPSYQTSPDPGVSITYTPASAFEWTASDLAPGQGGVITVIGVVDNLGTGATISHQAVISASEDAANAGNNTVILTSLLCHYTDIVVTNANDSGPGSLRQAIEDLCEGGRITFDADYTIYLSSTLTLDRSGVTIDGSGHQIAISGDRYGDGTRDLRPFIIEPSGVVTLSHLSVISGSATGIFPDNVGGGIFNEGDLTLESSVLYDNYADDQGGGLRNTGYAHLINSTVVSNTCAAAGGGVFNSGVITLTHTTIARNSADDIGGFWDNWGTVYIRNSIIADNYSSFTADCFVEGDSFHENINNIIGSGDCNEGDILTGYSSADPKLGTLDYHGGDTLNLELLVGSPAIATGDTAYCTSLDQRDSARTQYSNLCDRGAHEADGANPTLSKTVTPVIADSGEPIAYTLSFINAGNETATGVVITDTLLAEIQGPYSFDYKGVSISPIAGTAFAWTAADLPPGQDASITVWGTLDGAGTLSNTAYISSSNDIYGGDNIAQATWYACNTQVVVTTDADSGPGSLRDLLAQGCTDYITFAADYDIYLSSTLAISGDVTIDGSGRAITISGDSGNDGSRDVRPFYVWAGTDVTLSHLNVVSGTGFMGGGILNEGTLSLDTLTLADNVAEETGTPDEDGWGGAISNEVSATLDIKNSLLIDNKADGSAGAILNYGWLYVENSTFYQNYAYGVGALDNAGTATVNNSTFAYNGYVEIGGVYNDGDGTLTLQNSILAHSGGTDCFNYGTVNITHTIVQTDSVVWSCGAALTGDPLLQSFGDYGGETATLALQLGSPALDAGDDATCAATDQRGFARPQGPGCDMGAYEYERPHLTLVKEVTPGNIDPGDSVTYTLRFVNDGGASAANVSITDTVPGQMINLNDAWAVDGGLTLSRTIDTTFTWTLNGDLGGGQGGVITITGQFTSPLPAGVLTNTAIIRGAQASYPVSATAQSSLTVNNIAPVMGAGAFMVFEDAPLGFSVGSVSATDANLDAFTYAISDGNSDSVFAIDKFSGQIVVTDTTWLNYESTEEYVLTIAATDGGLTGTNQATIVITDVMADLILNKTMAPLIADPGDTVSATLTYTNAGQDTASDVVIVEPLMHYLSAISYQTSLSASNIITYNDGSLYAWAIGSLPAGSGGAITLTGVLSRPLARGTSTHTAVITTTSYDLYPENNSVPYGVYINNIALVITPTILSVSEAALDGSEVGMVDVFDANGDTLAFTVTAGNEDGIFAVNGPDGLVTVADRSNLDYETQSQYVLDVDASDGVFSATSVVTINVVDADADLALLKTVTPTRADPGDTITYTLIFSNVGGDVAAGVVITDWLPFSVTVQSVISSGNVAITRALSSQTLEVFETSEVPPGGSDGIITLTAQLSSSLSASTFTNTATIATTSVESDTTNNTAEAGLIVQNVAPVAEDDVYAIGYETPLIVLAATGVLSNDLDVNGDPLTATLDSGPISGTLSLNLDGSFIYTPTAGFSGLDSFDYVVGDGALTDTATVLIDVGVAPTYTLTIAVDGTGSGSVDPDAGQHVYELGTIVTLTAAANLDSEFVGWNGALGGTTSPITLTMNANKAITATFDLLSTVPTYTLSVIISPTVGGMVALNPSGGVYVENSVVSMTAFPTTGYEFVAWSGDLVSALDLVTITMTQDMTVTANFDQTGFAIYLPLVLRNY